MPRRPRVATGGIVFHVLNRATGRRELFSKPQDFDAFERIIALVWERVPIRLLAHCLMPNHWHFVLWPRRDNELSEFMRLLSVTHAQRLHAHRHSAGQGPVYQGRFKSFPAQSDGHLLKVGRYVERNALRAELVKAAVAWRWCSAFRRKKLAKQTPWLLPLSQWPIPVRSDWQRWVQEPQSDAELAALRESVVRGSPFGDHRWRTRTAEKLNLQSTLNPRGRPIKHEKSKESEKELIPP